MTNKQTMLQFHLLDVLSHDFEIEGEDEQTTYGHFGQQSSLNSDDEGSVVEVTKSSGYVPLNKNQMFIELFGTTLEGKSLHVTVTGFQPYFYVRISSRAEFDTLRSRVIGIIKKQFSSQDELYKCIQFSLETRKLLFGYTANRAFPMAKITVNSLKLFNAVKKLFLTRNLQPCFKISQGAKPLEVFEANLDPMLRFFHIQNIEPCGWIEVPEDDLIENLGTGALEGQIHWSKVVPASTKPGSSAPFKLLSWDIECYSESGDFPVPEKDPIIQIGCILLQGQKLLGKHLFVLGSCDPIEDTVVHSSPTEKQLLLDWASWFSSQDPDILVGYNIFGFDERYVWKRAEALGVQFSASFQSFSKQEGETVTLKEKMLSSSALGDNRLYTWWSPGRLHVDLLHYIRRLEALPSYKLDSVTAHYMSGKLKGITQDSTGRVFLKTNVTKDVCVGRSITVLDETGEPILEKGIVESLSTGEIILEPVEPIDGLDLSVKWAIVKDDVSPQEIFKFHRGSAADRAVVGKYCIQDCALVLELYNKLDVFNNALSMANVCSVPVNYIFTRGQGIKIESLIFKECLKSGQAIKVLESPNRNQGYVATVNNDGEEEHEDSYEGAIVFDPIPDFYFDSPIGVCDFASLYPSSIISENISYDTLLWAKDYDLQGKLKKTEAMGDSSVIESGIQWTDIEFDIWQPDPKDTRKNPQKIKVGTRVCRYAQPPGDGKGTLPSILQKLLAERKAKRKQAEKETNPFVKALLDAEQLAYKLTANSLYGQLGSPTFKVRLTHLAASTTAYGRKQITYAKEAIETFYGPSAGSREFCAEIVYGDTDSLFVNFNPKGADGKLLTGREALVKTIALTEECGKFVSQTLKPPHDFEYDKVFWPFVIFSKKRYVGNKYEENPDEFKQTSMGIVLKRRDNAPIVKTIYGGAIKILMSQRNVAVAAQFVRDKCRELVEGKVSLGQLTITKSLKANYADPTRIAHKVLADRILKRDPGNAPAPGDRIPYIYITTERDVELQGDRIESPLYIKQNNLKPDVAFYIQHQLEKPLAQLFALRLEEIPGFVGPMNGWPEDLNKCAALREKMAMELLFSSSLQTIDTTKRRKAAERMGFKIVTSKDKTTNGVVITVEHAPVPQAHMPGPKKQMVLDSWFADKLLVDNHFKKKRQSKSENGPESKSNNSTKSNSPATNSVIVPDKKSKPDPKSESKSESKPESKPK